MVFLLSLDKARVRGYYRTQGGHRVFVTPHERQDLPGGTAEDPSQLHLFGGGRDEPSRPRLVLPVQQAEPKPTPQPEPEPEPTPQTAADIPQHVKDHVTRHANNVHAFNEEIGRLRDLGQRFGAPGRYEYEYRTEHEATFDHDMERLAYIEGLAQQQGIDKNALYAHVEQGIPAKRPWSPEALAWHRPPAEPTPPVVTADTEETAQLEHAEQDLSTLEGDVAHTEREHTADAEAEEDETEEEDDEALQDFVLITGNTYPIRRTLVSIGARWNAEEKGYVLPPGKAGDLDDFARKNKLKLDNVQLPGTAYQREPLTGEALRAHRQGKLDKKIVRWRQQADRLDGQAEAIDARLKPYNDYAFWTEPIKIGHYSENRHRRLRERLSALMDKRMHLQIEARALRDKAGRASQSGARIAGDKERARQAQREEADTSITVGRRIHNPIYGEGVVRKVNQRTYTVQFDSGHTTTVDKAHARDLGTTASAEDMQASKPDLKRGQAVTFTRGIPGAQPREGTITKVGRNAYTIRTAEGVEIDIRHKDVQPQAPRDRGEPVGARMVITTRDGRKIERPAVNTAAAERMAREHMRTYRTDTNIRRRLQPGRIELHHPETGDRAQIFPVYGDEEASPESPQASTPPLKRGQYVRFFHGMLSATPRYGTIAKVGPDSYTIRDGGRMLEVPHKDATAHGAIAKARLCLVLDKARVKGHWRTLETGPVWVSNYQRRGEAHPRATTQLGLFGNAPQPQLTLFGGPPPSEHVQQPRPLLHEPAHVQAKPAPQPEPKPEPARQAESVKEPWQMTRAEFRTQENTPKVQAIKDAIRAGKQIMVATQLRGTILTSPEHIRMTRAGHVQTRERTEWVNLTDEHVDKLATQAGYAVPDIMDKVYHHAEVAEALKDGKPVPAHVRAEYPDLQEPAEDDEPEPEPEPTPEPEPEPEPQPTRQARARKPKDAEETYPVRYGGRFNFTSPEVDQIVAMMRERATGANRPTMRLRPQVKEYALAYDLLEQPDRKKPPTYNTSTRFQPLHDLPPEALWRIVEPMLGAERTRGISITGDQRWHALDIAPVGDKLHTAGAWKEIPGEGGEESTWVQDEEQRARTEHTSMEAQADILQKLAQHNYVYFQRGGSIWEVSKHESQRAKEAPKPVPIKDPSRLKGHYTDTLDFPSDTQRPTQDERFQAAVVVSNLEAALNDFEQHFTRPGAPPSAMQRDLQEWRGMRASTAGTHYRGRILGDPRGQAADAPDRRALHNHVTYAIHELTNIGKQYVAAAVKHGITAADLPAGRVRDTFNTYLANNLYLPTPTRSLGPALPFPADDKHPSKAERDQASAAVEALERPLREFELHFSGPNAPETRFRGRLNFYTGTRPGGVGTHYRGAIQGFRPRNDPHPTPTRASLHRAVERAERDMEYPGKKYIATMREAGLQASDLPAGTLRDTFNKYLANNPYLPTPAMGKARLVLSLLKARRLHYRTRIHGLPVSIENRRGSIRRGTDPDGNPWEVKMEHPYGYVKGTVGMDGEQLDCFVGPCPDAKHAYIITTRKAPDFTEPDEQKAMLGFRSAKKARKAFLRHYDDPRHYGNMLEMPIDEFKAKARATMQHPGPLQAVG